MSDDLTHLEELKIYTIFILPDAGRIQMTVYANRKLQFRIGGLFQGHNIPDWFRVCSDFLYISMFTVNFVETRSSVPVFVTSIVLIPFANFLIKVLIFI